MRLIDHIDGALLSRRAEGDGGAGQATQAAAEEAAAAAGGATPGRAPLYPLLDARDPAEGWGLAHFLAALDDTAALAALLVREDCPYGSMDDAGRSPLALALSRNHLVAARLLQRAMRRRELPWASMWDALARDGSRLGRHGVDEVARLASAADEGLRSARAAELEARTVCATVGGACAACDAAAEPQPPSAEWAARKEGVMLSAAAESLRQRLSRVVHSGGASDHGDGGGGKLAAARPAGKGKTGATSSSARGTDVASNEGKLRAVAGGGADADDPSATSRLERRRQMLSRVVRMGGATADDG